MNLRKPYIVCELSANHLGKLDRALGLIEAAAKAGADAVKIQTYNPEDMAIPNHTIQGGAWAGLNLQELYTIAQTPRAWHKVIFKYARELGIDAFSTVYDRNGLDFLEGIGCTRYKISSFEILDTDLITAAAITGKPIIISTGMATFDEIRDAVYAARRGGSQDITLLACVSAYPAKPKPGILNQMNTLSYQYGCKVGLSDHTLGVGLAVAATAYGADMLEKHLTLKRADGGLDASFSIEPHELENYVAECRAATLIGIGCVEFGPDEQEQPQYALRRSLWWARDGIRGEEATPEMMRALRPAGGLPPSKEYTVVGRSLARDVKCWEPVSLKDLA